METGATAPLSEITIADSEAAVLYKTLQERTRVEKEKIPMTLDAVNIALSQYNPRQNSDAEMYALWAHDAYIAGVARLTFEQFVEASGYDGSNISRTQIQIMIEAGRQNIEEKPGVIRIGNTRLTKRQTEMLFLIDKAFKRYGKSVFVVDDLYDEEGSPVNGLISGGKIVISLKSEYGLLNVASGHELFHWLSETSPEMGAYLRNLVITILKTDGKYNYEELYKQRADVYKGLDEMAIEEEIAAQFFGVVFSSEERIKKTVAEASEKERGFLKKIISHLKDFLANIKNTLRVYGVQDKTVEAALRMDIAQMEALAEQFDAALIEAIKNKKATVENDGVKQSIKITKNMPLSEQIAKVEEEKLARSDALYFGNGGSDMLNIGFSDSPFAMYQGDYRKSRRKSTKNSNYSKHGVKQKVFETLSGLLSEAVMFVDNGDKVTVITNELMADTKGQPSYVILGLLKDQKMDEDNVHLIKSVYPLDDFSKRIQKYAQSGQLVVTNKNKADELLARVGIQTSERSRIISLTKDTLSQSDDDVKQKNTTKYSVKIDAEGNKFVDVDPKLFDVRDGESHAKTIARIIKDRFNNLISVNGQQIQINKTTNDEWRRSKGADALKNRDSQGYFDKLKTIPYVDEILKIAKNWIDEELHHPRKDDIAEFARGNVYYRVGDNGYVADVIVAIRKNGNAVLYDLDDIRAKKITDVSLTMASRSPQRSAETSVTNNVTQNDSDVKKKYSKALTSKVRKFEQYSEKQLFNWKNSNRIVVYENDLQFMEFVSRSIDDILYDKKLYFGAISEEYAGIIEENTGINVKGFNCSLSSNEIRKIIKTHGNSAREQSRGQRAFTKEDFLNIPKVILAADNIRISDKTYNGKPVIEFVQQDSEKYNVAAVVSDKHMDLFVQTAFVNIKKGNLATPTGEQAPINTPKASNGTVSDNIIFENSDNVKNKYSKQLTSSVWEDIRTMMYENEVHEEIIGEIEKYVGDLRRKQASRQELVTEGTMPTYEGVLKVARDYVKGSEVKAQDLADVIYEMMWAAQEGELDTSQFISSVQVYTEEILRTGHTINRDKYNEYSEFRAMTRAETVYVSRAVYDQYVEEYGSVKNLNRATAGKIRIKPETKEKEVNFDDLKFVMTKNL